MIDVTRWMASWLQIAGVVGQSGPNSTRKVKLAPRPVAVGTFDEASTSWSPDTIASVAGETKSDSSKTEYQDIGHVPLILPAPSQDLGFEDATFENRSALCNISL